MSFFNLLFQISTSEGPVLVSVVSACWMLLTEQRDHVVARSVIRTVYHPSLLSPDVSDAVADRLHQVGFKEIILLMALQVDMNLEALDCPFKFGSGHWF